MASSILLNSAFIRKVAMDFAKATGLAVVIVDIDGREISDRFNFSKFCLKIRENPELYKKCMISDRLGGLKASADKKPCVYQCHTGLTDFSIPFIVEGHLVGFVLCGQVRIIDHEKMDDAFLKVWEKDEALRALFLEIPTIDYQKIEASAEILQLLIDHCVKKHFSLVMLNHPAAEEPSQPQEEHYAHNTKIKKALRFIKANLGRDIKLENVSEHIHLSPDYFSKLFKKHLGMGFNNYLTHQRIDHAKVLLESSQIPIATIAKNVGFAQTNYFCKVFRKISGSSPKEYREKAEVKNT